jgi:hypothetical protein
VSAVWACVGCYMLLCMCMKFTLIIFFIAWSLAQNLRCASRVSVDLEFAGLDSTSQPSFVVRTFLVHLTICATVPCGGACVCSSVVWGPCACVLSPLQLLEVNLDRVSKCRPQTGRKPSRAILLTKAKELC